MLFDKEEGSRIGIRIVRIACGPVKVDRVDDEGNLMVDRKNNPIRETRYIKPETFILRFIPHASKNGRELRYRETLIKHKDANGLDVLCDGSKSSCPYCEKGDPKYQTHYSVVDIINSTTSMSAGIYVLEYRGWLEHALKNFEEIVFRDRNCDITSLLDDGCDLSIHVYLDQAGKTAYKIAMVEDQKRPYSNEIRNDADVLEYANSNKIPDLSSWIENERIKLKKSKYVFQESNLNYVRYDSEFEELKRSFDFDVENIEDAVKVETDEEQISRIGNSPIKEDYSEFDEMLKNLKF